MRRKTSIESKPNASETPIAAIATSPRTIDKNGNIHGGGRRKAFTKRQLLAALNKAGGIRSGAAQQLGVSPSTVTRAMGRWPEAMKLEADMQDRTIDIAITKTISAMQDGEPWAIKRVLDCFGRRRGWVRQDERVLTGPDGGPVQVAALSLNVTLSPETLKAMSYDDIRRALEGDMTVIERLTQGDPTNGNN